MKHGARALVSLAASALTLLVSAAPAWAAEPAGLQKRVDAFFSSYIVAPLAQVLFLDVWFWDNGAKDDVQVPIIVLWLVAGAVYFTLRMGFINVRGFGHAIAVTRGHYDDEHDPGEVSHFQALSSALSATVGLGNIAGVAIAIGLGGPGATFWMIMAGLLGMSSKFSECTLGQMYRDVDEKGHVLGGPMRYLAHGLADLGSPKLGRALAILFALLCIGGSFGGGNMFQANQSHALIAQVLPVFQGRGWAFGLIMAFLVGIVIIGGIRRIGAVAGYIVPFMCAIYVMAGLFVIITNYEHVPAALGKIIVEAFSPQAGVGGAVGVLITGFKRAAFSNEAGIGSASIAHSAAATKEPIREGIVALLEPFIDTVVICTMTALVVVITDVYSGDYGTDVSAGVRMTAAAFATVIPWFPDVLALAVFFFAFSTMISWSYYGERCWTYLFGAHSSLTYRVLFLVFAFLGPVLSIGSVLDFSDLMILGMALPNILGVVLLSGKVRAALDDYWSRLQSGEMKPLR